MRGAPRALPKHVMLQLERPETLARFPDPRGRLLARILMNTGLRVGDGAKLRLDCITRDGQGAPYLRYTNHKMRRDAFVRIDTDLAAVIADQQQTVLAEFANPMYLLPRRNRNPEAKIPFSTATFRGQLVEWLLACEIRDATGRPVHITPHQWRHTFGTRLINSDIPQETVRRLLDHDSHAMTAHYARLSDTTIRQQWERARKVLPQHHRQLEQTRALIESADRNGHQRLAEMNRTVERNLLAIITGLTAADGCCAGENHCSCSRTGDSDAC